MEFMNQKPQTIIVIGDIMLDVQIYGKIEKIANEAPIPVLHEQYTKKQLGGCGNVLMNLQNLGCDKLFIISRIGKDESGKEIENIISKYPEIIPKFCVSDKYTTTVKTRGFVENKIIFRYDIEQNNILLEEHISYCKDQIQEILSKNKVDSIIFSDYNKGFLIKEVTQDIIQKAKEYRVLSFVDPKVDYTKYKGCTVFKPNIKEIKDIFGIHYSFERIKEIHEQIQKKVECKETLLTLSENGMSYLTNEGKLINKKTISTEVCDVTGAGDIVLSIITYYYKYFEKEELIHLATWLATHSVKHAGTYVVKRTDILQAFKTIQNTKLITSDNIRHFHSNFVITNGCFDIVHEGHIALFKFCKSIVPTNGYFVVALNSDESIKRLKGSKRPINSLESRIALLNQIECIDWIVVFDEDTPYELYKQILPKILVKGGDYTVQTIVGKEFCEEIKIFNTIPGKSSTSIIERIQSKN